MPRSAIPKDGAEIGSDNQRDQTEPRPPMALMRGIHRRLGTQHTFSTAWIGVGKGKWERWDMKWKDPEVESCTSLEWTRFQSFAPLCHAPGDNNPVHRGNYFQFFFQFLLVSTTCFYYLFLISSYQRCYLLISYCGGLGFSSFYPPPTLPLRTHTQYSMPKKEKRDIITDPIDI